MARVLNLSITLLLLCFALSSEARRRTGGGSSGGTSRAGWSWGKRNHNRWIQIRRTGGYCLSQFFLGPSEIDIPRPRVGLYWTIIVVITKIGILVSLSGILVAPQQGEPRVGPHWPIKGGHSGLLRRWSWLLIWLFIHLKHKWWMWLIGFLWMQVIVKLSYVCQLWWIMIQTSLAIDKFALWTGNPWTFDQWDGWRKRWTVMLTCVSLYYYWYDWYWQSWLVTGMDCCVGKTPTALGWMSAWRSLQLLALCLEMVDYSVYEKYLIT